MHQKLFTTMIGSFASRRATATTNTAPCTPTILEQIHVSSSTPQKTEVITEISGFAGGVPQGTEPRCPSGSADPHEHGSDVGPVGRASRHLVQLQHQGASHSAHRLLLGPFDWEACWVGWHRRQVGCLLWPGHDHAATAAVHEDHGLRLLAVAADDQFRGDDHIERWSDQRRRHGRFDRNHEDVGKLGGRILHCWRVRTRRVRGLVMVVHHELVDVADGVEFRFFLVELVENNIVHEDLFSRFH